MKFKIVGDSLIYIDEGLNIVKSENEYDIIEIEAPHYRNDIDSMSLSFRLTATSAEDHNKSACQILMKKEISESKILLIGSVTSDFSSMPGKVFFMITGTNTNGITAVFDSTRPIEIRDNISLASLPNQSTAEQLFNQAQLEAQRAMNAAAETREMLDNFTLDVASETVVGGIKSGNDISVSSDGTVTVNSVNGKTVGKSVPVDAVFTDTVYTLPKASKNVLGGVKVDGTSIIADKNGVISAVGGQNSDGKIIIPTATTDTLGGVKVDGKTITASDDGTISAMENENLKSEILNIMSFQKDISNLAVQIALPNNFLIYDDLGKPSVMVAIPKFYLDEVIEGASHTIHPAFIINGVEQDVIYISKYQNIVENNRAYSLPIKDPAVNITFDQAWNYCKNKGNGWHLMTNAEWAAIALWCKKNGTMPKGNNNFGKDISETYLPQKAVTASTGNDYRTNRVLTGSGRESWHHDGTFAGIADLNGNVWEWNTGMRLNDGEIQVFCNNDSADWNNSISYNSMHWKAIMPDSSLVTPGTTGTLKYNWKYSKCTVSTTIGEKSTSGYGNTFETLAADIDVTIPEIMKALAIYPADDKGYEGDYFYMVNSDERIPLRSGGWTYGASAGVFSLNLGDTRSSSGSSIGFRSAYYNPKQAAVKKINEV